MIKDAALLKESDYSQNLRILEEMLEEAIHLKILPLKKPLDGIDVDVRIARVINSV